ncbi:MAG: AAA family ATPase [Clostridia bacterium]|nr:AAA family ATPase [Clostridia bacterium]
MFVCVLKTLAIGFVSCYNKQAMKVTLTADQKNAEKLIAEWFFNTDDKVFVLSGYAGTGKTFLIDYLAREVLRLEAGVEAVFVSPTGKAAANLVRNGTVAGTVHSLIYIRNEEEFDVNEDGEIIEKQELSFIKRDKIDERIRLIVVDEASMINETVLNDLLSFNVKCLFCGDGAQLPPVNGTCPLMQNPHYTMTEIVRQAEDNPIIQVATMARKGERIPFGKYGDKVCVISKNALSAKKRRELFLKADQILCGRNKTRNALNAEIRAYKGIPETELLPVEGEKLICTLNDWEKPLDKEERFHLVNGVIGIAKNVRAYFDELAVMDFIPDFTGEAVKTPFDTGIFTSGGYRHLYGERAVTLSDGTVVHEANFAMLHRLRAVSDEPICRFEFAYAVTCHKAQGSEFDFVIVFDESWAFGEERNRWLYTAITRAKDKLLIIR